MSNATSLLLVVPNDDAGPTGERLLRLAQWLAAQPEVDLSILVWRSQTDLAPFAEFGRLIDAGEVNRWPPARLLQRLHLDRVARPFKSRRLRAALDPVMASQLVYVGGPAALDALAWLDCSRPIVVQVDAHALTTPGTGDDPAVRSAMARAALVVATDEASAVWLAGTGVPPDRIRRLALLDPPLPGDAQARGTRVIGLVGLDIDETTTAVASMSAALPRSPSTVFRWYIDERTSWRFWQGRGVPSLAWPVEVTDPASLLDDLGNLDLIAAAPACATALEMLEMRCRAGVLGVPIVVLDGPNATMDAIAALETSRKPAAGWTVDVETGGAALLSDLSATVGSAGDEGRPGQEAASTDTGDRSR